MALDGSRQINDRVAVERLTEQHVCTHDARNRARRGRAKAAGLRDSAVLNDGQAGKRLAALVVDALCTLIDQVALVLRDILTVFIRNINMIVLCEVDHVVQLERNADAVIARAHIGARSRNGYTNHCISLLYRIRIAARTSPRPFSFSAAAFISAVDSLRV